MILAVADSAEDQVAEDLKIRMMILAKEDLEAAGTVDLEEAESLEEGSAEEIQTEDPLRCMRQSAINAGKNVKFHSNQLEASQYTAANVLKKMIVLSQALETENLEAKISSLFNQEQEECLQSNSSKLMKNLIKSLLF